MLLLSTLLIISASDMLSVYLVIELQTLCFYILASFRKNSSFEGLHFYVGFMENEVLDAFPDKRVEQRIFISSQFNANVTIGFAGYAPVQKYTLKKGVVTDISIPVVFENRVSENISKKLIEINQVIPKRARR